MRAVMRCIDWSLWRGRLINTRTKIQKQKQIQAQKQMDAITWDAWCNDMH